ncbi:MAG: SH3 domain-containing protein [Oscillospiraceae bacterium]|nr:SH3 domain-containing protein [Oscillospiraceae bacterium]
MIIQKSNKNNIIKAISLFIIICVIFSLSAPLAPVAQASGTFRTTDDVNVRAEPTTNSAVLHLVYKNVDVTVIEHNPAGWSSVSVAGVNGFIRSDFLRFPVGTSGAEFFTTGGVHVRSSGSTSAKIVTTVEKGTKVTVTEHNPAGWSRVRVGSNSGFIRSDFLSRTEGMGSASNEITSSQTTDPSTGTPDTSTGVIATLKTIGSVNLRATASDKSNIIRTLPKDTNVEVLENDILDNKGDKWSRVSHNGANGFILSRLLTSGATVTVETPLRTIGGVNLRAAASDTSSVIRTLVKGTSVDVLENDILDNKGDKWSRVTHNGTNGFILSRLLTSGEVAESNTVIATMKTVGSGVRLRTGPGTTFDIIRELAVNVNVEVLEHQSNGWSRVRHDNTSGFIKSSLLWHGSNVELLTWPEVRGIIPMRQNIRVVDVRTGISFNIRVFSLSEHADFETPTQADTDLKLRTRNGVWSWAARPVWITIGNRVIAASMSGMPHDVSTIRDNGINGHFCMHFHNTNNSHISYRDDLRRAVVEAYDKRPR